MERRWRLQISTLNLSLAGPRSRLDGDTPEPEMLIPSLLTLMHKAGGSIIASRLSPLLVLSCETAKRR